MIRWKMNKLGFLNFWLYDEEEFPLHNGHILLRGITPPENPLPPRVLFPLFLTETGVRSGWTPLAPWTEKWISIFWATMSGKNPRAICIWNSGSLVWRSTVPLGLGCGRSVARASTSGASAFRDGRRIGPGGLCLCETMGKQKLPLSKQKLRNLIGNPDCWAESPTKYKEMVNTQIFGFRDIRQYDQLVQLLILVRAPKLSKDFRPSEVKKNIESVSRC